MSAHVLIVEDNADLAFGLQRNLEFEGYRVEVADDGHAGQARALTGEHDLVILDLMLPGQDGMTVLGRLREAGLPTPVLILTARDAELDKVRGLRSGADDYLTKPFGVLELVARVEALLRRSGTERADQKERYSFGDVEVDVPARVVSRDGRTVPLTPREFALVVALLRAGGDAVSRKELLRGVWGHKSEVATRTVDTHVVELRRKLEPEPSHPRHILTVRKFGYRLDPEA
jgi:DNA-binding response OmpR family regulator